MVVLGVPAAYGLRPARLDEDNSSAFRLE